jgi:broad specificity phosphatase PhoE
LEKENKTLIYLTRHGQTEWNIQKRYQGSGDSPLTEMGIKQAQILSDFLANTHFDVILSSPAGRARRTAEIIKGKRNQEVFTNNAFAEINLGSWEGKYYYDIELEQTEQYQAFWNSPDLYKPAYGESFIEVGQRTYSALKELVCLYRGKTILIVSHAVAIKSLLNTIEGRDLSDFWNERLMQTSLSIVEAVNGAFKILQYGSTVHLGDNLS